jgi:hypothetical protein
MNCTWLAMLPIVGATNQSSAIGRLPPLTRTELLLIPLIYSFTRVDWRALFNEWKMRWLRKTQ